MVVIHHIVSISTDYIIVVCLIFFYINQIKSLIIKINSVHLYHHFVVNLRADFDLGLSACNTRKLVNLGCCLSTFLFSLSISQVWQPREHSNIFLSSVSLGAPTAVRPVRSFMSSIQPFRGLPLLRSPSTLP